MFSYVNSVWRGYSVPEAPPAIVEVVDSSKEDEEAEEVANPSLLGQLADSKSLGKMGDQWVYLHTIDGLGKLFQLSGRELDSPQREVNGEAISYNSVFAGDLNRRMEGEMAPGAHRHKFFVAGEDMGRDLAKTLGALRQLSDPDTASLITQLCNQNTISAMLEHVQMELLLKQGISVAYSSENDSDQVQDTQEWYVERTSQGDLLIRGVHKGTFEVCQKEDQAIPPVSFESEITIDVVKGIAGVKQVVFQAEQPVENVPETGLSAMGRLREFGNRAYAAVPALSLQRVAMPFRSAYSWWQPAPFPIDDNNPYALATRSQYLSSHTVEGRVKVDHEVEFAGQERIQALNRANDGTDSVVIEDRRVVYSPQCRLDCCERLMYRKLIIGDRVWTHEVADVKGLVEALDQVTGQDAETTLILSQLLSQGPLNNIGNNMELHLFAGLNMTVLARIDVPTSRSCRVFRDPDNRLLLDVVMEVGKVLMGDENAEGQRREGTMVTSLLVDLTNWKAVARGTIEI